ncbi:MAG TPA: ABC-2 family transporter protein [bacterium]|nr:ABC-2 family transporter protein [bacterium]
MKKYLKIWWRLISMNWQVDMMYKWSYLVNSFSELFFHLIVICYIYILFSTNDWAKIAGFTVYDFYFVYIISELINTVCFISIFPSATRLKNQIYNGYFDILLIKPKNWFVMQFYRSWVAGGFQRIFYETIVFFLIYRHASMEWNVVNIFLIIFVFCYSVAMFYFIYWNSVYLYFFYQKFDTVYQLVRTASELNQYPVGVYPRSIQWFFTFVIPVFLVANPVYKILNGTLDVKYIGGMMLVLLVFLMINVLMRKEGMRRYESAA